MDAVAKFHHRPHLALPLPHRLAAPISSLSLTSPISFSRPHRLSSLSLSFRASSKSLSSSSLPKPNNKPQLSLLKTALIAGVAAASVFFSRLTLSPKPTSFFLAAPPAMAASESADEERERELEVCVSNQPDDVQALKDLMEAKVKNRKVEEAIGIVERLIELEPDDMEWPLMRAHLHCHNGNMEKARVGFNELLEKDPTKVEAFHGLVMAASEEDSGEQLKEIEKRVHEAMEICRRENRKKDDVRDFKLLIAQIKVIEGNYNEALKVYQDLVKEEPRDFRPYLCQGIVYTLLRKTNEAEKQFEKYRRLVPKGHPYAQYFEDNMIATKIFGQQVENERAAARS